MIQHWLNRWSALWHPERYHGWGRKKGYFEGWYYKVVSNDERLACAFIPGISIDASGDSHSFIQVIDGTSGKTFYHRYEPDSFRPKADSFAVTVGNSYFDMETLKVDVPGIQGQLRLSNPFPWPKTMGAPGVMGWYSFVPFMQCYHGIVSMNHSLSGHLTYEGTHYDFDEGLGYIEKDWGTSFPRCWIWMQSNHFEELDRRVSFMASIAHIPWLGHYFVGFLVGILVDDELFQFTTYNKSEIRASLDDSHVYLNFSRGALSLDVKATKGHTGELASPIVGEMTGKVNESLSSSIQVKLTRGDKLIYQGAGKHAGLEVAGDVSILLDDNGQ